MVAANGTQTLDALRQEARTDTRERILEAAYGCIARVGLARTTVEDVAKAAGLSRQTIYRYYLSKDHLVMALVLREEEKFLDGARAAFARADDLRAGLEDAIAFCLRFAREHPLLDRLLAMDSETLLPYLTLEGLGPRGPSRRGGRRARARDPVPRPQPVPTPDRGRGP